MDVQILEALIKNVLWVLLLINQTKTFCICFNFKIFFIVEYIQKSIMFHELYYNEWK
jgi:hypothetical protein